MRILRILLLVCTITAPTVATRAEPLPQDAGILNVRTFGARGNGQDDDTSAFLQAITASGEDTGPSFWQDRIVYVPNGIYRVSAPLLKRYRTGKFGSGLILLGESEDRTILRLSDHAPGFEDSEHPQAVIFTTSKLLDGTPTSGGKDYIGLGEGNDAYMNFIENMTIDVGAGNPGAIAIDFLGNNIGAIRNVTLRAKPGSGAIGLSMTRKWPGPTFIQNLTVQGFGTGIATAQTEYGLTFEHIRLYDQTLAAIRNDQNALTIRDLDIRGPSPAIINGGAKSFLAIDGGHAGTRDISSFIRNDGIASLRTVALEGGTVSGVLSGRDRWTAQSPPTWRPTLADSPPVPAVTPDQWVNPVHFGATGDPNQDATDALRRAIATGAAVLYLPHGIYAIHDSIDIPASLQRIVGMNSTIKVVAARPPTFARSSGMFRIASSGPSLAIERLAFDNSYLGDQLAIEVSGQRDVTIRDVVSAGVTLLDRKPSGGRVFLEDVCCGRMQIGGHSPVFARQFDTEGGGVRIANQGSPLSILGLKTEGTCTIVDNAMGARTDIFGGLVYVVRDGPGPSVPAFRNSESWLSTSFAEESLRAGSRYDVYLGRNPSDPGDIVSVADFPERGFGRFVPDLRDEPR